MLLALLQRHGEVLEADLAAHYHVDLADLWRGQLTLRRLKILIQGLPTDCRTAYALADAEGDPGPLASWRLGDVLLGRLADELALLRWQWECAHIDQKKHRPRERPPSVLPEWKPQEAQNETPLVSPHRLGGFVNDTDDDPDEEEEHG